MEARREAEQGASRVAELEAQAREAWLRQEYDQARALERQADALRDELAQKAREADAQIAQGKDGVTGHRAHPRLPDPAQPGPGRRGQGPPGGRPFGPERPRRDRPHPDRDPGPGRPTHRQAPAGPAAHPGGGHQPLHAGAHRAGPGAGREAVPAARFRPTCSRPSSNSQEWEQLLKAGQTLPVDADVSKAKEALDALKTYADQNSQFELKVATEKAQAAIGNVETQIEALNRLETESQHLVRTNVDEARAAIQSLDGMDTSSTHTIHVQKVEDNASGGLVGAGVPGFAAGGAVSPAFPRLRGGSVPGSGNRDTVPRTLDAGAFVLRKAAVRKYGAGALARLANGVARFAGGGSVGGLGGAGGTAEKDPRRTARRSRGSR